MALLGLEQVVTSAGRCWHLCERGLRLIAASHHMHIRIIAEVPDEQADKTEILLNEYGPLDQIWLNDIPTSSQVEQPSNVRRKILFNMVPQKVAT